jgi:hypothetical protein
MQQENFKVIIILPVYPAGDINAASTQYLVKYTYKALNRQSGSLIEKLREGNNTLLKFLFAFGETPKMAFCGFQAVKSCRFPGRGHRSVSIGELVAKLDGGGRKSFYGTHLCPCQVDDCGR